VRGAAAALVVLAAVVAGCRATPAAPTDMALDLAGVEDFAVGVGDDLATADMACPVGPEICNNGCDDDRNGYTDADDPACTSQMLVTLALGSPNLSRLILEPTPHTVVLDGNPVLGGGMATHNAAFAAAAFLSFDAGSKRIERRPLGGGAITVASPVYSTRDVCVFNGELIVVQPLSAGSYLHRFSADGATELGKVAVSGIASACSSDGKLLYVARYPPGSHSEIAVYQKSAGGPVDTGTVIAMPDALLNAGYDRLIDLVYVKKGGIFVGLFAVGGATADSALDGQVMAPFAFDGGVRPFIDGGVWHGVGEFLP